MVGGFASWVVQLLGSASVDADDDGAEPDQAVETADEWAPPDEALPEWGDPPPAAPFADALPYLLGDGGGTSAMMATMSGPGLCTPHP